MKTNFLTFYIILALISLLFASEPQHLYKIINPDRTLINQLERMGAVTSEYLPGKDALIYLSDDHLEFVKSEHFNVIRISDDHLTKSAYDTLSPDHVIGNSYHTYEAVQFILDSLESAYPDICSLTSIGQTVQGREILSVNISDNHGTDETEPEVYYIANIHGDERITQEIMLMFIEYLLRSYESDQEVRDLVNRTDIYIIPNMNFDGTAVQTRFNANGADLNRNFPDREPGFINPDPIQPETQAIIDWSTQHTFVLGASFHAGALVANYPWDKNIDAQEGYAETPDDGVFRRLALSYSTKNAEMFASSIFENGITNGADWYETSGSMQDWNYYFNSCMEITVELSQDKSPDISEFSSIRQLNIAAMLNLLQQVHSGIRGVITDSESGFPLDAQVLVAGIDKTMHTDPDSGDYYRLLEPGVYQLTYDAEGYQAQTFSNVIIQDGSVANLNVSLSPITYYTINGTVVNQKDGFPVQQALIEFSQNEIVVNSIRTDIDGEYEITIPEGIYNVSISHPDFFSLDTTINVFSEDTFDFYLERMIPGRLSGIVKIIGSGSVAGSVVYVQGETDTVANDGLFEFSGINPGNINIFAYKFGYKTTHIDTVLLNGDSLSLQLDLFSGSNEFFTDFEDGNPVFEGAGDWEFGTISSNTLAKYFGSYVWGTILAGEYSAGIHRDYLETPIYSIQGFVIPQLEFYHIYDIEETYDGGNVKVSADEGKTWRILHPSPDYPLQHISELYGNPLGGEPAFSGKNPDWEQAKFDLSEYINQPFLKFRFDFGTDEQKVASGWYIDRFHLFDANATIMKPIAEQPSTMDISMDIYPNPANPDAIISFQINKPSEIRIQIINLAGQVINEKKLNAVHNTLYQWRWEGINSNKRQVASGLYFVRISSDFKSLIRKLVIIR
jgi:predicted deacylase